MAKCKLEDCCFHDYHKGCDFSENDRTFIDTDKFQEIVNRAVSLGCKNEKVINLNKQEVKTNE
jgi:hypothetical protein